MFSILKCEVYLNNTMVYNANGLYPHKAQISIEFNQSAISPKEILVYHGHRFEKFQKHLVDRVNSLGTRLNFSLYGKLAVDLFI